MAESFAKNRFDAEEIDTLVQLVGFQVEQERFGVNILMVQEIIRSTPITPVPNSPSFVEGVINLRGVIIPVIDLRKRLNLYNENSNMDDIWILILDIEGKITGFIVDKVTEVIKVDERQVEQAPEIIVSGLDNQYISGVVEVSGHLLILLDFSRVLLIEEVNRLKKTDLGSAIG